MSTVKQNNYRPLQCQLKVQKRDKMINKIRIYASLDECDLSDRRNKLVRFKHPLTMLI